MWPQAVGADAEKMRRLSRQMSKKSTGDDKELMRQQSMEKKETAPKKVVGESSPKKCLQGRVYNSSQVTRVS